MRASEDSGTVTVMVRTPLAPPCHPWSRCTGTLVLLWCPVCGQEFQADEDRLIPMQDLQAVTADRRASRADSAGQGQDARLAMVAADYPDWQVWAANGHAYATRRTRLSNDEWRAGLAATVHANTVENLREALAHQSRISAELDSRHPWPIALETGDEIR